MPQLRILGPMDLRAHDGSPVEAVLAQPKRLALLAYLALEGRGGLVQRDLLLATFWPDADGARGRASLRRSLHFLRTALGSEAIVTRGDAVGVAPEALWCDAVALATAVDDGHLEDAVALHRGDLLAGLHLRDANEFEDWLARERERLRSLVGEAFWTLAGRAVEEGDGRAAAGWAARAVELTPYDEGAQRRRIALLLDVGDRAGAIRAYEEFASWLAREYQAAPSAETRLLLEPLRADRGPDDEDTRDAGVTTLTPPVARNQDAPPVAAAPTTPEPVVAGPHHAVGGLADGGRPGRRLAWLAAAAMLLTVGAWAFLSSTAASGVAPAAESMPHGDGQRVVVLPFAVRGDARLGYLGEGMVDLLSTQLDGVGPLQAVDPNALLGRFHDLTPMGSDAVAAGQAAASSFDAELFVVGSVVQAGDRLALRASLYTRNGSLVAPAAADADEAGLPAAVDELARQLLVGHLVGPGQQLTRLAVRTTSSAVALRAYLAGNRLLRDGRFAEAADSQRAAVRADTGFALAYYGLSMALGWLSYGGDREATLTAEEAVKRGRRLGPKVAATLRAHHASWNGRPAEAERLYREILSSYPEDVDARNGLAEVIFHEGAGDGRRPDASAGAFELVSEVPALRGGALLHLARMAAWEGETTRLDSIAHLMESEVPEGDGDVRLQEIHALQAFVSGGDRERTAVLTLAGDQSDAQRWHLAWAVARFTGSWDAAESLLASLATPDRPASTRAPAWLGVAMLRAAAGRPAAAMAALDSAALDDPEWAALARAGLHSLPLFPATGEELERMRREVAGLTGNRPERGVLPVRFPPESQQEARERVLHALDGRGELVDDGVDRVMMGRAGLDWPGRPYPPRDGPAAAPPSPIKVESDWARQRPYAVPFLNLDALDRFHRGYLLAAAGRTTEADRWYAGIPAPDGYEVPLMAPAILARARLAESGGRFTDAIALYRRFAIMWSGGEPGPRSIARDARRRAELLASRLRSAREPAR